MNKYTAIGIAVGVAAVGAVGYILYNQYQQQKQSVTTSTNNTAQEYYVHIDNACNYSIIINYTDPSGNQKTVTLGQDLGITINVQAGSSISITDSNGNQILSPTPVQSNMNLTTCQPTQSQQGQTNNQSTNTQTQTVSGCVGQGCSSNQTTNSNNNNVVSGTLTTPVTLINQCNYAVSVTYVYGGNGNTYTFQFYPYQSPKTVYAQPNTMITVTYPDGSQQQFGPTNANGNSQTITVCQPSSTQSTTSSSPFYEVTVYNGCNETLTIKYQAYNSANGQTSTITDSIGPFQTQKLYPAAGTYLEVQYPVFWVFPGSTKKFGPINSAQNITICSPSSSIS